MAGLYFHIPFCKQACHYCDFHFSTSQDLKDDLVNALCQEIEMQKSYLEGESIDTIYFGGGTPSLLSGQHLQSLFDAVDKNFVTSNPEVTLEANPDDLSEENLAMLKAVGVNRLSIGIQSFDDNILKFLNRAHSSHEAFLCLERARHAGIDNISIDLIYAIPGQGNDLLKKNIEKVISISPEHVSAYSLTIEEKTVFGKRQKKGIFPVETEEAAAAQMEILMEELGNAGFDQYEISNFCKPGFYSRHNSSYWQQKKYLGIGPSAHSYNGLSRQSNINSNTLYIKSITQGKIPCQIEILTRANKINEYLFTTLRTTWGCNLNYLLEQMNYDLMKENHQALDAFIKHQFVTVENNILRLSDKGKLLADKIASDLFIKE
ncbi:MAG TPA: radical SAM family heme chaperone HemW [Cyclobacteriaceae bacterium]|jgi:oxygen-independent coproporphyrinogen-3 oxidase|nr:radical SAM family heme chaperone HemW [Cyclobacteriaceae bacterium]